jgi:hypothetical protein
MTKEFSRSPDDLPSSQTTQIDGFLRRQLEVSIGKNFYDACTNKVKMVNSLPDIICSNCSINVLVAALVPSKTIQLNSNS